MDRWWWYIIYIYIYIYSYCSFFFSSQWNVILSWESLSNLIFEHILLYLIIFYPTLLYLIIFYRIWSYLLPPVFFWILLEKREKGRKMRAETTETRKARRRKVEQTRVEGTWTPLHDCRISNFRSSTMFWPFTKKIKRFQRRLLRLRVYSLKSSLQRTKRENDQKRQESR